MSSFDQSTLDQSTLGQSFLNPSRSKIQQMFESKLQELDKKSRLCPPWTVSNEMDLDIERFEKQHYEIFTPDLSHLRLMSSQEFCAWINAISKEDLPVLCEGFILNEDQIWRKGVWFEDHGCILWTNRRLPLRLYGRKIVI